MKKFRAAHHKRYHSMGGGGEDTVALSTDLAFEDGGDGQDGHDGHDPTTDAFAAGDAPGAALPPHHFVQNSAPLAGAQVAYVAAGPGAADGGDAASESSLNTEATSNGSGDEGATTTATPTKGLTRRRSSSLMEKREGDRSKGRRRSGSSGSGGEGKAGRHRKSLSLEREVVFENPNAVRAEHEAQLLAGEAGADTGAGAGVGEVLERRPASPAKRKGVDSPATPPTSRSSRIGLMKSLWIGKRSKRKTKALDANVFGCPLASVVHRPESQNAIPLIFRQCLKCIEQHGLSIEGLHRQAPSKQKLDTVKAQLSRGEALRVCDSEEDILVATGLLQDFLQQLPETLLTDELEPAFDVALGVADDHQAAVVGALCRKLPRVNHNVLGLLCQHLNLVSAKSETNKMSRSNLVLVFSQILGISKDKLGYLVSHAPDLFHDLPDIHDLDILSDEEAISPPTSPPPSMPSLPIKSVSTAQLLPAKQPVDRIREEMALLEKTLEQHHKAMNRYVEQGDTYPGTEDMWTLQRKMTELKRELRKLAPPAAAATPGAAAPAYLKILDPNDESTHVDLNRLAVSDVLESLHAELLLQNVELSAVRDSLQARINQEKELQARLSADLDQLGPPTNPPDEMYLGDDPAELEECLREMQAEEQRLVREREHFTQALAEERRACMESSVSLQLQLNAGPGRPMSVQDLAAEHGHAWSYKQAALPEVEC